MHETLVEAAELHDHLNDPDWVVVDCRFDLGAPDWGAGAYSDGHVPGAVYAHLGDELSGPPLTDAGRHPMPSPEALRALFSRLGIGAGMQVVAYDQADGAVAARLWWQLRYMGHAAAAVLNGGWNAWQAEGYPTKPGTEQNTPAEFAGEPRRDRLVTVEQVPSSALLVDARDPARYRGEREPLDPVAGHIPGAANHFYKENLGKDGRFASPEQVRERLLATFAGAAPEDVTFYCGSGVTACHDLLAVAHAGLPGGRLYGGSWSEWCSDPTRPVATGPAS